MRTRPPGRGSTPIAGRDSVEAVQGTDTFFDGFRFRGASERERRDLIEIEPSGALSSSSLWAAQRRYFHRQGIGAWGSGTVPHYVTNNPRLAHAYAEVVLGWMRDCRAASSPAFPSHRPLDPKQPVTIVELGAGSGRFAYLFLRAIRAMLEDSPFSHLPLRYVMTDFTETNVSFWRSHDALQPFVREGVLDFAMFDAERDPSMTLLSSGVTLAPGGLANPLVVVANYVFDGIPLDAFRIDAGNVDEWLVSLHAEERVELDDPDFLSRVTAKYTPSPVRGERYPEPELTEILHRCVERLDHGTLLFPSAALRCLRRLAALADGRMLLLSADRGGAGLPRARSSVPPSMSAHGSFSMDVDYDAIAELFHPGGGGGQSVNHQKGDLHVAAFQAGTHPEGHAETRVAFQRAMAHVGPDDFFDLRRRIQAPGERLDLDEIALLLRLSKHDPRILADCIPFLSAGLEGSADPPRAEILEAVRRCWDNHYFIQERHDLAHDVAVVLYELGAYEEALARFADSTRTHGDARKRRSVELCLSRLRRPLDTAEPDRHPHRIDVPRRWQ
jgi:hypothetical protein